MRSRTLVLSCTVLFGLFALSGCSQAGSPAPTQPINASPTRLPASPTVSPTSTPAASVTSQPSVAASLTPTLTETRPPTPPPGPLAGAQLLAALRHGGYVIYFRHAATDPTPDDRVPVDLSDCATQRNLSEEGRQQARTIALQFEQLGIPAGRVLSSPFCRALDTLRPAFGEPTVEPALENLETAADDAEIQARTEGLRALLSTPPEPGTNTILAGHGFNLNGAASVSVSEGEAAIFRPLGDDGFELVATVSVEEWAGLEQT